MSSLRELSDRALIQGLQRAVLNARHGRSTSGEISPFAEEAARRWGATNINDHYMDLMAKQPCRKRHRQFTCMKRNLPSPQNHAIAIPIILIFS